MEFDPLRLGGKRLGEGIVAIDSDFKEISPKSSEMAEAEVRNQVLEARKAL